MRYFIVLFLLSSSVFAQFGDFDKIFDQMEKRMESLMRALDNESGIKGFLEKQGALFSGKSESNFDYFYKKSKEGRTLVLIPKNKEHSIDIKVNDNSVVLSGKTTTKKESNDASGGHSSFISESSFSNTLPIPNDCLSKGHKITNSKDKKEVYVFFPYKNKEAGNPGVLPSSRPSPKEQRDDGLIPLFESAPEETI